MQIAKMFASLGFKVDTAGLDKFKRSLSAARSEITNISRGAKTATSQFRNLRRETDKLSSSMNKIKNAGGTRSVGGSYRQLAADVWRVRNALDSITTNQPKTTRAIGKINSSVIAGLAHWNAYRRSIVQTRQSLANLNADLARLRANARIDIRINQNRGGAGGGAGGSGGGGGLGGAGGLGALGLLRSSLPAMALAGGFGSAGFAGQAAVTAARDQTRMESMILMTSKSGEEFARTIDYVRTEALRLGLSSTELGKSFAQVSMSAKGLNADTKEKMFTGFSEFMMSMGTSADDQKGIFRAFNQMFSNNRILQEEINQLSDRGIPATLVMDAAMKAYNTNNIRQIKKLQEDGKLDPNKVLPIMAEMVQNLAHDSGAYAKMMQSSVVKQGKFYEELRQTSKEIMDMGLDELLGDIFGALTLVVGKVKDLAIVIKELSNQYKTLKTYLQDNFESIELLYPALLLLVLGFGRVSKGVRLAHRLLVRNAGVVRAFAGLLRGIFGRALGLIILRYGAWAVAIWAVSKAVSYLSNQLKKDSAGHWTIFDDLALKLELTGIEFDILSAKASLFWTNMKAGITNPEWLDTLSRVVGINDSPAPNYNQVDIATRPTNFKFKAPSPYPKYIPPKIPVDGQWDMTEKLKQNQTIPMGLRSSSKPASTPVTNVFYLNGSYLTTIDTLV